MFRRSVKGFIKKPKNNNFVRNELKKDIILFLEANERLDGFAVLFLECDL